MVVLANVCRWSIPQSVDLVALVQAFRGASRPTEPADVLRRMHFGPSWFVDFGNSLHRPFSRDRLVAMIESESIDAAL